MRVSVIVPVFNTGRAIEALLDSLRAQTLRTSEWEAVFVDDGSTDDTADLVEGLIAGDPNMRLLREAPSGWPGRPRNVGVDAAKGDYVFFSDDDDTLGPEALERLTDFAVEHDSDVVVPRTVGRNRGVPAITRSVIDAQEEPALIMRSLAPQKLFRRALLQDTGIRFAEGPFRLEDHLFVVTAYLRAKRVSTYADYPCYYLSYQPGRPHISQQRPDWHAYFLSVRACLDRVDAEATDDRIRRVMRSRWLRAEALSRLRGDAYAKLATPELLAEVRALLVDRFTAEEFEVLRPVDRLLALLLLEGRDDDVAALARWESSITVASEATEAAVLPDGTLRVVLRSALAIAEPLPVPAGSAHAYPTEAEVLEQVAGYTEVGVELQHAKTKVRRPLTVEHEAGGVTVALLSPAEEALPAGRWTLLALAGEHRTRRRRPVDTASGAALEAPAKRVGAQLLRLLDSGRLVLQVQPYVAPEPDPLSARIARRARRLVSRNLPILRLRQHHG